VFVFVIFLNMVKFAFPKVINCSGFPSHFIQHFFVCVRLYTHIIGGNDNRLTELLVMLEKFTHHSNYLAH
jgi:hypothetical protein